MHFNRDPYSLRRQIYDRHQLAQLAPVYSIHRDDLENESRRFAPLRVPS